MNPEPKSDSLHAVITRFMRVIQPPRVGGVRVFGAMDIAPLDCLDKPGNDEVVGAITFLLQISIIHDKTYP
jgi:hypothetical protein